MGIFVIPFLSYELQIHTWDIQYVCLRSLPTAVGDNPQKTGHVRFSDFWPITSDIQYSVIITDRANLTMLLRAAAR